MTNSIKPIHRKKGAAANPEFQQAIHTLLLQLGARQGAELGYDYTLATPVGDLWIRCADLNDKPWLACMFRDVERARFAVPVINPYSGKWNHMHDDVAAIQQELRSLLGTNAQ